MNICKVLIYRWLYVVPLLVSISSLAQTNLKSPMIVAHITLKSASGSSILDKEAVVTSETVSQYKPAAATVRKAKKLLKSDGFDVTDNGIGLSVSTTVENFEKVFGVKVSETKVKRFTVYKTQKKIPVPNSWKNVIESVDLPEPVEYH